MIEPQTLQTKNLHITFNTCVCPKHYLFLLAFVNLISTSLFSQIQFTEVTQEVGIDHHFLGINEMGAGAAFFDMDNDGDEDLWLAGGLNRDVLYENDGQGNFTEIGVKAGLNSTRNKVVTGVITGDLDNDGFKDVLLITHIGFPNVLMKNMGDNTFEELFRTGIEDYKAYSLAAAFADVNQDGYLDIYAGHYIEKDELTYSDENRDTINGFNHQCHTNQLYLNNGDWTFTNVTYDYGVGDRGCALATAFSDYDGDNDVDIIVANDFGAWVSPNALLENQLSQNRFQDVSEYAQMDIGIYGMGIAIGDYDNDLDLDYYITNLGENVLCRNEGNGIFSNPTKEAGIPDTYAPDRSLATGWGTAFIDFDNDRDLDLYVVNGYVPAASFIANARENSNKLFENDGKGIFTSVAPETQSSNWGRGLASADIDNDGDIDFLVGNVNKHATSDTIQKVQLFRNDTPTENNWLKIKLEGTKNNRDGLGSRILLKAAGKWSLQEANGGYGTHASQHSSIVHFGLGTAEMVDSLVITWMGGEQQILAQIAANQLINIKEVSLVSAIKEVGPRDISQLTNYPNPFSHSTIIQYHLHQKNNIEISIFDQLGRNIYQSPKILKLVGDHSFEWSAPDSGIYYIHLQTDNQFLYKTIISN